MTVGKELPAERVADAHMLHVETDGRRAVVCESVVPRWLAREPIGLFEIVDEQLTRPFGTHGKAVQIDVLAPVVRPETDEVALVRDHVIELELSEEPEDRRVCLAALLSGLDRDR